MLRRIESFTMSPNFGDYETYGRISYTNGGNWGINQNGPGGRRYLSQVYNNTQSTQYLQWPIIAPNSFSILGHSFRVYVPVGTVNRIEFHDAVNGNAQVVVTFNGNNGVVGISSATTLFTSNLSQFPIGAWFWVEIMVTVGTGTSGAVSVRLPSTSINISGVNTAPSNRPYVDLTANNLSGSGYFMDMHWWDTTGSYNNTFLGDRGTLGFLPTANGDTNQYAPNGQTSNYLNAASNPPNSADFNASSTVGAVELYKGASASTAISVGGVQASLIGYKSDSGTRSQAVIIKSGGATASAGSQPLPDSAMTSFGIFEADPSTNVPFVPSALPLLQWGGEVTA